MKHYLIDSENVGDFWIPLLDLPAEQAELIVFYTKNSPHMSYDSLIKLKESDRKVTFIKCYEGTNALDFQLCSELGFLIAGNEDDDFIIVTNDTGYDAAVKYWRRKEYSVKRIAGKDARTGQRRRGNTARSDVAAEVSSILNRLSQITGSGEDDAEEEARGIIPQIDEGPEESADEAYGSEDYEAEDPDYDGSGYDDSEESDYDDYDESVDPDYDGSDYDDSDDSDYDESEESDFDETDDPDPDGSDESEYDETEGPDYDKSDESDYDETDESDSDGSDDLFFERPLSDEPVCEGPSDVGTGSDDGSSDPDGTGGDDHTDGDAVPTEREAAFHADPEEITAIVNCIGMENLAELHNQLIQFYGENGKDVYKSLKSLSPSIEKKDWSREEKFLYYCVLILRHSDEPEESLREENVRELAQFLLGAENKRKNLNSLRYALLKHYGKEKGRRYYFMLKPYVKALNQM